MSLPMSRGTSRPTGASTSTSAGAAGLHRRDFLRVSAALGGGLLVAFHWPARALAGAAVGSVAGAAGAAAGAAGAAGAGAGAAAEFAPNAFVRIATDGRVTVIVNKAEMGQGVSTSLCMLLAEELDADWTRVGFEFAPVDPVYAHPGFGIQMTGGSTSTLGMSEPMRRAGAAARALLVAAAAQRWGVSADACRTENGAVLHAADGRRAGYGELADAAAELEPPADVPLKDPKDFRIVGTPTHRLDTPDKVAGRALFGMDVRLPGMLTALVAHPPVFGGTVNSLEIEAARAVPGVRAVVNVGSGVAVIAEGFWAAKRGRDALQVDWHLPAASRVSSDELRAQFRQTARAPGMVAREEGDVQAALAAAARTLEADYEVPYLAHAALEPLNCTVDLRAGAMDLWIGTQFQTVDHAAAATAAGLPPDTVRLHSTYLGGGFGRRANPVADYVVEAVKVARAAGAPVQLIWTREDDMRGGFYRPMFHSRMRGGLDAAGEITAWTHTIVGQSIMAGTPFAAFAVKNGIDGTSVEGAEDVPYAVPNLRVDLHTVKTPVPVLWWRSVGHSHTAFVVESFLDELAHAAGQDPLALRRTLLAGKPRHLGVLELAAARAGWGTPPPAGRARGLAVHHSFGSFVAMVAEVGLEQGRPRVHRVTVAVDCGRTVNPDTVRAQMEGAVGFALTAALFGEITLSDGRVQQSNFHDYKLLRVHEMPAVDVHIVESTEPSSGVGEPGVPPLAPAVGNALFALTGRRVRRLPIRAEDMA
jgi:isoquinoline 1-oxidoreductase beta subunit